MSALLLALWTTQRHTWLLPVCFHAHTYTRTHVCAQASFTKQEQAYTHTHTQEAHRQRDRGHAQFCHAAAAAETAFPQHHMPPRHRWLHHHCQRMLPQLWHCRASRCTACASPQSSGRPWIPPHHQQQQTQQVRQAGLHAQNCWHPGSTTGAEMRLRVRCSSCRALPHTPRHHAHHMCTHPCQRPVVSSSRAGLGSQQHRLSSRPAQKHSRRHAPTPALVLRHAASHTTRYRLKRPV